MRPLILTTCSTSETYQHRLAEISSRATLSDPLNNLFQREKSGPLTPVTTSQLYEACINRIRAKIAAGALIAEAAEFAAVACWEPPQASPPELSEGELQTISRDGRPIYAEFVRNLQNARREVFGDHRRIWSLSLMARDPDRKDKGAVRAVIEPFVERARMEGLPIWLVAGNARARDVYAYFGFKVMKVLRSGPLERTREEGSLEEQHETAIETWYMVANWPPVKVD